MQIKINQYFFILSNVIIVGTLNYVRMRLMRHLFSYGTTHATAFKILLLVFQLFRKLC